MTTRPILALLAVSLIGLAGCSTSTTAIPGMVELPQRPADRSSLAMETPVNQPEPGQATAATSELTAGRPPMTMAHGAPSARTLDLGLLLDGPRQMGRVMVDPMDGDAVSGDSWKVDLTVP